MPENAEPNPAPATAVPTKKPGVDAVSSAAGAGAVATARTSGEASPKSTRSHHLRTLREARLIRNVPQGRRRLVSLRREELDAHHPGLLEAVLQG